MHIGQRPFSGQREEKTSTLIDMRRLIVPAVLLMGLAFYSWYRLGDESPKNFRPTPLRHVAGSSTDETPSSERSSVIPRAPERLIFDDLPSLPGPTEFPPYEKTPEELSAILSGVVDGSGELDIDGRLQIVGEDLLPEQLAIDALFHRVRADVPVEIEPGFPEFPGNDVDQAAQLSRSIRGQRHRFTAEVIGDPYPSAFRPFQSGVPTYWNLFVRDRIRGRLHRVLWVTDEKPFPIQDGDDLLIEADYLRLYAYESANRQLVRVPQWIGAKVELDSAPVAAVGWAPVFWVTCIALGGLALLSLILFVQHLRRGSFEERRRAARTNSPALAGREGEGS